jgi:hypothetical protein
MGTVPFFSELDQQSHRQNVSPLDRSVARVNPSEYAAQPDSTRVLFRWTLISTPREYPSSAFVYRRPGGGRLRRPPTSRRPR